jgi:hypothetical protein
LPEKSPCDVSAVFRVKCAFQGQVHGDSSLSGYLLEELEPEKMIATLMIVNNKPILQK